MQRASRMPQRARSSLCISLSGPTIELLIPSRLLRSLPNQSSSTPGAPSTLKCGWLRAGGFVSWADRLPG